MSDKFTFPKGFLWGSATSAHQVEGGNHNDWSEWEKSEHRIADLKSRGLNPDDFISGHAVDHYNRFHEDFDIAQSLGYNAHRFSIEWSRIEPEEGKFNEKEIEHYRDVLRALRERGIEPLVTLWHWTMPLWLSQKGGVWDKNFSLHFENFAEKVVTSLGESVSFWIIINEPEVFALNSFLRGKWPPQKKGIISFYRTIASLILAHRRVYRLIKEKQPNSQVGIAVNQSFFESAGGPINNLIRWACERVWNRHFLMHTVPHFDFIGLNYYFHNRINYGLNKNENRVVSDIGWELYPGGIYSVLKNLKRYQKPIYITENGLADAKDEKRTWFIQETLKGVARAIKDGADVKGYLHWSLLDNFEWDKGFSPRFGLVEVNYSVHGGSASGGKTLERRIRPSALEYKKIIALNSIEI